MYLYKLTNKNENVWHRKREKYINGVFFTFEVTEYFMHQLPAADWLARAHDSTCAEASKTRSPSFISVTLAIYICASDMTMLPVSGSYVPYKEELE
jgi:hypothetical protein